MNLEAFEVVGDVLRNKVTNFGVKDRSEAAQAIANIPQIGGTPTGTALGIPEVINRIGHHPAADPAPVVTHIEAHRIDQGMPCQRLRCLRILGGRRIESDTGRLDGIESAPWVSRSLPVS